VKRPPASEPLERELGNGLRVVVSPLPHLRAASIVVAFGVGSRHEAPEDSGLTHLLEHMVYRGTARFPTAYELNHAIESLGGDLDGATGWKRFRYITWPGLVATRTFILITITIAAFSLFTQVSVMTQGGPLDSTTTVVYMAVRTGYQQLSTGYASAISLVFFVLVLLVSLAQRLLTREKG